MENTVKKNVMKEAESKKRQSKTKISPAAESNKRLRKRYLKSKPLCKVTFRLPKEAAAGAKNVTVVGDFNNWNITQTPMKRLKSGDFTLTLELPCNREFNFRYLIDTKRWENDWFADKYIPNEFGEENSVVVV